MDGESRLKKVGGYALGLVVMLGVLFLVTLLSQGMVWASKRALPWLISASSIAFYVCVLVLLPLCIFRKARPWAAFGFFIASYLFGAMLFAFSCIVVFEIWWYGGLVAGLVVGGVGVVPLAFVATLSHALWWPLLELVIGTVLTFGARVLAIYLAD